MLCNQSFFVDEQPKATDIIAKCESLISNLSNFNLFRLIEYERKTNFGRLGVPIVLTVEYI